MEITKETRQLSYEDIKPKRKVRYDEILDRLDHPKTAKEIAVELYELGITTTAERNTTAPRLTELEKKGIVRVVGKEKDKWSGKMVAVYELADMNHIPSLY